jgi:hypothetical protein
MGFIIIYFLFIAVFIGLSIGNILKTQFPNQNIVKLFCGFILYYFSFDLVLRFMLQDLPTLSVQPYLLQNIKKKDLVGFLNIRSLFSLFNLLPIVLFLPFCFTVVATQLGPLSATALAVSILSITFGTHYLVLFLKRKTIISVWWMVGFLIVIISLIEFERIGIFSISKISDSIFMGIIAKPIYCFIAIAYTITAFIINYQFLLRNLYFEDDTHSNKVNSNLNFSWLSKWGIMGELITLELKLIIRNKRPRTVTILAAVFLLYGFIFFNSILIDKGKLGMILIFAGFITGGFIVNYGQYLLAWQSANFDGIMTSNIDLKTFFKSRFLLCIIICTFSFLISLLYGIISWKVIPIEIAAFLFNIGIHTVICTYLATFSFKYIDISKGASFNYEGMGVTQWALSFLVLLVGAAIYLPFEYFFNSWAGVIAVGVVGLISLVLQDWWINIITKQFVKNKYKILSGFREK